MDCEEYTIRTHTGFKNWICSPPQWFSVVCCGLLMSAESQQEAARSSVPDKKNETTFSFVMRHSDFLRPGKNTLLMKLQSSQRLACAVTSDFFHIIKVS